MIPVIRSLSRATVQVTRNAAFAWGRGCGGGNLENFSEKNVTALVQSETSLTYGTKFSSLGIWFWLVHVRQIGLLGNPSTHRYCTYGRARCSPHPGDGKGGAPRDVDR